MRAAARVLDADARPDDQHPTAEPQHRSDAVAQSIAISDSGARDALADRDGDGDPAPQDGRTGNTDRPGARTVLRGGGRDHTAARLCAPRSHRP